MSGSNGKTITAANAKILLTIPGLYPVPQLLEGFAADDVYDVDDVDVGETLMGVDGKLSGGFVPYPIMQAFSIQADSDSITFFEQWLAAEQAIKDKFWVQGVTELPSVNRTYVMANGLLTRAKPVPTAKKLLQPRVFRVTWEAVFPAPAS